MIFHTGFKQPNKPSRKLPPPVFALWNWSLISSWCWLACSMLQPPSSLPSSPQEQCSSCRALCSSSCSCSCRTLFSKWPCSRLESSLSAVQGGLLPLTARSSSRPGCRGTGRLVGGARSVMICGGGAGGGAWGEGELLVLAFFRASPTTVSLSSSLSFPTRRLGQEVQDSTSGELPMVPCMCSCQATERVGQDDLLTGTLAWDQEAYTVRERERDQHISV